jgi:hypothetical protein
MKKTKNILLVEFVCSLAISLTIVILFETDIFVDFRGLYAGLKQNEFILSFIMELITIIVIPISLKMIKIKRIKTYLTEDKELSPKRLLNVGTFRILMLSLPMIVNILLYYLYWQTTFGYMAIILFFCLFFVFPSSDRCESETTVEN